MADFLDVLAGRALGAPAAGDAVRPRARARFEPAGPQADEDTAPEADASVEDVAVSAPAPGSGVGPGAVRRGVEPAAETGAAPDGPPRTLPPGRPGEQPRPVGPAAPAAASTTPAVPAPPAPGANPTAGRGVVPAAPRTGVDGDSPPLPAHASAARTPAPDGSLAGSADGSVAVPAAPLAGPLVPVRSHGAMPAGDAPAPEPLPPPVPAPADPWTRAVPVGEAARGAPVPGAGNDRGEDTEGIPTWDLYGAEPRTGAGRVSVTIGTVEVRLVPASPQPERPRPEKAPPRPERTLADHLARHRGGRR